MGGLIIPSMRGLRNKFSMPPLGSEPLPWDLLILLLSLFSIWTKILSRLSLSFLILSPKYPFPSSTTRTCADLHAETCQLCRTLIQNLRLSLFFSFTRRLLTLSLSALLLFSTKTHITVFKFPSESISKFYY